MTLLQSPLFWLTGLCVYVLMNLDFDLKKTTQFGILNAMVLAVLLGVKPFIFFSIYIGIFWFLLYGLRKIKGNIPAVFANCIVVLAATIICGSFILHKLNFDKHGLLLDIFEGLEIQNAEAGLEILVLFSFSYVFLRLLDVFIMAGLKEASLLNPVALFGYVAPFHMLASGPIAAYKDHLTMDNHYVSTAPFGKLLKGINTITGGLLYKFVIAQGIRIFAFGLNGSLATPEDLSGSILLFIYVFFDFAGYSKIALGIGQLLNVPTPVNFQAPLMAVSITDFWKRWHMSLGSFVNRNIYTPLQLTLVRRFGIAKAHWVTVLTLIVSFAFVGIWHRLTMNFLVWGGMMGLIMFLEKIVRDYGLRHQWNKNRLVSLFLPIIGPVYVILVVSASLLLVWKDML